MCIHCPAPSIPWQTGFCSICAHHLLQVWWKMALTLMTTFSTSWVLLRLNDKSNWRVKELMKQFEMYDVKNLFTCMFSVRIPRVVFCETWWLPCLQGLCGVVMPLPCSPHTPQARGWYGPVGPAVWPGQRIRGGTSLEINSQRSKIWRPVSCVDREVWSCVGWWC